jgi:hypoxanthine phosphoribosyltransferase
MVPHNFKELYSREMIAKAIGRMGGEIDVWAERVWQESHTDLLVIPVLRGGIFVFADLVRTLSASVEIAPARTWAYDPEAGNAQLNSVSVNIEGVPAKGRSVLVVDDICDSGRSLVSITKSLHDAGAREVKSAVLIHRQVPESVFTPDWVGFSYTGKEWFVGYGMDDGDRWRNLPAIYIIQQG